MTTAPWKATHHTIARFHFLDVLRLGLGVLGYSAKGANSVRFAPVEPFDLGQLSASHCWMEHTYVV